MAKLGSYYSLCPLIDQNSLLGVVSDCEKGYVIVTLGKNIAIKYKFSDQKQIKSWSSKDKFSSPVIYDSNSKKYAAVFNQTYIRLWDGEQESLDKITKYKFKMPIHTLLQCENTTLVLFKNCTITSLDYALSARQTFVQDYMLCDTILSVDCIKIASTFFVGVMLESKKSVSYIWNSYIDGQVIKEDGKQFDLTFNDSADKIIGHFLHVGENGPQLFTLWSNDKLYSLNLNGESMKTPGELFTLITEGISCKKYVTMLSLDKNYVAVYGANRNEEGAILLIYNVQFRVIQFQQSFKLFSEGTKLWRIDNQLLLCVGQNLAVVPFHLDTEQLAALIGSHKSRISNSDPDLTIVTDMVTTSWTGSDEEMNEDIQDLQQKFIPATMQKQLQELISQGWSESAICEEILCRDIQKQDLKVLQKYLTYFKDISEKSLAKLLKYTLTVEPIAVEEEFDASNKIKRHKLIDQIFTRSFSDIILLPFLRTALNVDDTLSLLYYLCYLLNDFDAELSDKLSFQSHKQLIAWGCILLDAHYQHLLLSRDARVINVLNTFNSIINNYILGIKDLQFVLPLLKQIKQKKVLNKNKCMTSSKYCIEYLNLY